VAAVTGAVLGLLGGADALPNGAGGALTERLRSTGFPEGQLRGIATLLTPDSSALVTIVAPAGAAEVVGAVVEDAWKLAVEDIPASALRALAQEPALLFAGTEGAAVPLGFADGPHPAFQALQGAPAAPDALAAAGGDAPILSDAALADPPTAGAA
jgi:hypothetical protein